MYAGLLTALATAPLGCSPDNGGEIGMTLRVAVGRVDPEHLSSMARLGLAGHARTEARRAVSSKALAWAGATGRGTERCESHAGGRGRRARPHRAPRISALAFRGLAGHDAAGTAVSAGTRRRGLGCIGGLAERPPRRVVDGGRGGPGAPVDHRLVARQSRPGRLARRRSAGNSFDEFLERQPAKRRREILAEAVSPSGRANPEVHGREWASSW